LLCHGFSGSAHDFALNIDTLAADRQVVAIDHRGHGRSQKLAEVDRYSIDPLAADLIGFIDSEIGEPVDLLGHSMGGSIALRVTLARPELIRSLILMDTSAWSFIPPDSAIAELMGGFVRAFDPARGLPDTAAFTNAETPLIAAATPADWQATKVRMDAAFDPYALKALGSELFAGGTQWIRERLGEISCPVSVVVGEHDHPFVDQAPDLASATGGGSLTVVPGAYHSPQLTHPAEWTAAVQAHLARR
jgi:pimeloyl-ACP methyl ester carboxylesterase